MRNTDVYLDHFPSIRYNHALTCARLSYRQRRYNFRLELGNRFIGVWLRIVQLTLVRDNLGGRLVKEETRLTVMIGAGPFDFRRVLAQHFERGRVRMIGATFTRANAEDSAWAVFV